MESSDIKSLENVKHKGRFNFTRKKIFSSSLAFLIICLLVFSFSSQGQTYKKVKLFSADVESDIASGDIMKWNPTFDPNPTPSCGQYSYNAILLFDRSPRYLGELGDELQQLKDAVQSTLDRLALFAKNRNGRARVILGAYGTYNVWQNIPEDRLTNTNWDATREKQWRDSIDITDPTNLSRIKSQFLNIYQNRDPQSTESFDGNQIQRADLGYTGGEKSREFWDSDYPDKNDPRHNGWGFDNLHDALIQSAREVSRWDSNQASDPTSGKIDLVIALTSGEPNVNNGLDGFPSKENIAKNPPSNTWNSFSGGEWWDYYSGSDDIFRTQQIVSALRSGAALPKPYVDPNEGTALQLKDSLPAYDGKRNPVRVFGHAVISDAVNVDVRNQDGFYNFFRGIYGNPFLHMAQLFGSEYADYGAYNPPNGQHRHWDKTYGDIKKDELLSDMTLALYDGGCTPPVEQISPSITVEPIQGESSIVEGNAGTVRARIINNGKVPLENIEIKANANLIENKVYYQKESTCYALGLPYSCHINAWTVFGYKYDGGSPIATITKLDPGQSVEISYEVQTFLGSKSSDFPIQAWGHAIYDPTYQKPPADSGDINSTFGQSNGYVRAKLDVGFEIQRQAMPS
ncbi:MAG: hypothetical protein U0R17_06905 [Acidimicrobiia bacterium]